MYIENTKLGGNIKLHQKVQQTILEDFIRGSI